MARYVGGSLWVAAIATIYNGVIQDRTDAGASPADALAAGLARGSVFLAICAGAGIALVLLMARHKPVRPARGRPGRRGRGHHPYDPHAAAAGRLGASAGAASPGPT